MLVHPKQLIPGCYIKKDVMGKTNRPIISKNTVVHDTHIKILEKFLVEKVNVAEKLDDGTTFTPKEILDEEQSESSEIDNYSFKNLYDNAVKEYKRMFIRLQSGNSIDIKHVRKFMLPLLLQVEHAGIDLYLLHNYSSKSEYLYHHSVSMGLLSALMAKKLGYTKEWIQVGLAGLLADCGMSKMNRQLFNKEDKLTIPEYDEIKKHPTFSYRLVEHIPSLSMGVKLAILQHHERVDGNGYPLGVKQSKIHKFALILAISDTYHAMTSERYYKEKQSPFKVVEDMMQEQFAKYDHQILQKFITLLMNLVNGMNVRLSDGSLAEIVYIDSKYPTRPMVRVAESKEIITLKNRKDIYVKEIIS